MLIDVCIVSYNRPEYLSEMLASLLAQRTETCRIGKVRLFQDGPRADRIDDDRSRIDECIRLFGDAFPGEHVEASTVNVGIVGNYSRLWSFLDRSGADGVVVFEDDLVLAPHYLDVMAMMFRRAAADPTIGLVSASGLLGPAHDRHTERRRALMPMSTAMGLHRWGWGIARETIPAFMPFKRLYFDIANSVGYRDNGTPSTEAQRKAIRQYFWTLGLFQPFETLEIDGVYDLAALALDRVNLTTYASHARAIGREGLHFSDDIFARRGYQHTHVETSPPESLAWYEPERMTDVLSLMRRYQTNLRLSRHAELSGRPSPVAEVKSDHLVNCLYKGIYGWDLTDHDLVAHGIMAHEAAGRAVRNPAVFSDELDEHFGLLGLGLGGDKPYPMPYAA